MDHFVFPFPPITRKPTNMETWLLLIVSLCISALLSHLILAWRSSKTQPLPPGPFNIPILSTVLWLRKPFSDFEPTLRNLHGRHGPIISLRFGGRPSIFIANRTIAHRALVQNGAVFADRPPALPVNKLVTCNQHDITSSSYGRTWRVLRRNLTSEVLHPSRAKSYSRGRKWVLDILINRLMSHSTPKSGIVNPVVVVDHVRYAMFCLLVLMCFGDKLGEAQIKEIEDVQRRLLLGMKRFKILNLWPSIGKIVFRKRWDELFQLLGYLEATLGPLIEARKRVKQERLIAGKNGGDTEDEHMVAYVDTLLDLELPEEKRKLDVREVINLCSEFLDAGTDTSTTALQWIMANLVKYPHVQERLLAEIKGVIVGDGQKEVKEEDLHKLPYLKAVVLEGLRRHPPGHFVLPHAVTEDVVLDGYLVPKNGSVNFMVAEIGRDPEVWEDPMAFKPERFLSDDNGEAEVFDITGSREIKMMPFGAGRRMCPASGLAMLHLEYFVANLVLNFQWKAVDGDEVDLSEKPEFTTVMKYPLKAHLSPRF